MPAVVLESPALDGYEQMALDEVLLASAAADSLTLRLYRWSAPAVTFGYFQAFDEVSAEARGGYAGLPLVRRLTGGGIVYHDGDITFSLVFPWSRLTAASWIYKEAHKGVHLGLKARGIRSRLWSPPEGGGKSPAACFAGPSPMDLVREDGTKFLGGALRRRAGFGLYQGSLRPEGFDAGPSRLAESVVDGIGQAWKSVFRGEPAGAELLGKAERLADEKYRTEAWNKRR